MWGVPPLFRYCVPRGHAPLPDLFIILYASVSARMMHEPLVIKLVLVIHD
jgi:hypothetical protein